MTKITIDIDKPYNDKNIEAAEDKILSLENNDWQSIDCRQSKHGKRHVDVDFKDGNWQTIDYRRSAHDRLHVDLEFPDDMHRRMDEGLDDSDFEDMYFILFRLAAGDDIRRLRTDAKKFFKGEDIFHWLPSKDDYKQVAEREK